MISGNRWFRHFPLSQHSSPSISLLRDICYSWDLDAPSDQCLLPNEYLRREMNFRGKSPSYSHLQICSLPSPTTREMSNAMHCPHARDTARTLLVCRRVLNTQRVRVVVQITRARYIGTARGASMTGQLRAWVLLGVLGAAAGQLSCVQCPLDRYLDSSTPTTLCTSCPLDSSRIGYAASTVEDCKCNAGYTRSTGSTGSGCAQCA